MTAPEQLAPGAVVDYHGSLPEQHGTWTVIGPCSDCERCDAAFEQVWDPWYWSLTRRDQARAGDLFDRQYGHLFSRYQLTNENGERLTCVRRSSITPADQHDGSESTHDRTIPEAIAAQIEAAGCSVVIPDEPTDGVWRLAITGGNWTATHDVPVVGGSGNLTIEAADPQQAGEVEDLVRALASAER